MRELHWQKSSFSGANGGNCVEVAEDGDMIAIRESDREDEIIRTDRVKLAAFIKGVKAGEFDHLVP